MEHLLFIDDCQNHFIMVNDYIQENYGITNFYTAEVFLEADDSWFSKFIEGVKNFFINLGKKIWHFISHFPDYIDKFYNWLVNLTKSEEELNEKLKYDVIVQSQPIRKLSEIFGSIEKMNVEVLRLANMFNSAKEIEVDKESIGKLGNAISAFLKNINYDENKELIHKLLNNSDTSAILGELVYDERPQEQFQLSIYTDSNIDLNKSIGSSNLHTYNPIIYKPNIVDGVMKNEFVNGKSIFKFFNNKNTIEIQTHNFDIPVNSSNVSKNIYSTTDNNIKTYHCYYNNTTQTILWAVKKGENVEWKSISDIHQEPWFDPTKLLFNAGKGIASWVLKSDYIHKKVQIVCEKVLTNSGKLVVDRERNAKLNSVMNDAFRCFNMIKDILIKLVTAKFGTPLNFQNNNGSKLNNAIEAFSSKSTFLISRNYSPDNISSKINLVEGLWMLVSDKKTAEKFNPVISMDSIKNADIVEDYFQNKIIKVEIESNFNSAIKAILPNNFSHKDDYCINMEKIKANKSFDQTVEEYNKQINPYTNQNHMNKEAKDIFKNLIDYYKAFATSISYIRQYVQWMLFISKLIELTNKFITPIYTGKK